MSSRLLTAPARFSKSQARMKTNHFLFVASDYKPRPGGVAEYIDALARGLMSLGDTAKVLAVVRPDEKEKIRFLQAYELWVAPFVAVEDKKPANWLGRKCISMLEVFRCSSPTCRRILERTSVFESSTASIAKMERCLADEVPTTIVFGDLDVNLYPLALLFREQQLPYGILAHGSEVGLRPNNQRNDLVRRAMMLSGASWIAANSRHTKSLVETWRVAPDKVRILHPPISEEAIKESTVLKPTGRMENDLRLVTVCRLVKGKGIDIALRAVKLLEARGIPVRFVIGGDGPERQSLETLVDELQLREKVHFKGLVAGEEKWLIYRHGDVFVMPCRRESEIEQEGFGIAFVEAAAFGVPAVGSKIGGIAEAVVDGETGILVPEESPLDLADALTRLYRNPETMKEMGTIARERARRLFAPQAIAARFRDEVLKGVGQ